MKHLIWLVVILGVSANAETFRMVWDKGVSVHDLVCLEEKVSGDPAYGYNFYSCKSDDTWDTVMFTATLEVSCSSENVKISVPWGTSPSLRSSKSLYEIVSLASSQKQYLTMHYSELVQRLGYGYRTGKTIVGTPIIQQNPVDVWFYSGGDKILRGNGCGGRRVDPVEEVTGCSSVVTSSSLSWNHFLTDRENQSVVNFSISRESLWRVLAERQRVSDCHDRREGCDFETDVLKMLLWRVDYPSVSLIKLGDRVGRKEVRTEQNFPVVFSMFGRARAADGFSLLDDSRIPSVIYEELNHLQDYYNGCESNLVPNLEPLEKQQPSLGSDAVALLNTLKSILGNVWDNYKDMTLEELVNLP